MKESFLCKPITQIIIIIILGLAAYSNTFHGTFHFDDDIGIISNPITQNLSYFTSPQKAEVFKHKHFYKLFKNRYIGNLTFALNYKLHGLEVFGYHIVNLFIHIINALLVYFIVLLTFRTPFIKNSSIGFYNKDAAFLIAVLFVCHPIQTQAVSYIVQRYSSLATLFFLLAFFLYLKWRLTHKQTSLLSNSLPIFLYLLSILSTVLAMKTKEIAFTLPVIIFVYEFMFLEGNLKSRVLFLFPYCITMLIIPFAVLDVNRPVGDMFSDVGQVLRDETNMSRWDYLFTQFRVIPTYIRLLLLPIKQNLDYDFPVSQSIFEPQVFVSFLFLIAIVAFSIYAFFKNKDKAPEIRLITFGTIWFFITLSVESSIIPILDVFFEHRIYLPSFGFLMAISIIFIVFTSQHGKKTTRKILFVTSIGIAIILTVTTFNRNKVWKNELSLWHDVVRKSPNKARGYNYLGLAYSASNEYDKAINYFKQSIKLDRYYANPHSNLGIAYFNKGLIDESIHQFQQAILINPSHAEAHYNLGIAYGSKGLMKEAYIEMKKGSALSRTNK